MTFLLNFQKIPGVRYFFSAKDIPGKTDFSPVEDFTSYVEELFVGVTSDVLFYGQPVGVILADTMSLAMYASSKVKVIYVDSSKCFRNDIIMIL